MRSSTSSRQGNASWLLKTIIGLGSLAQLSGAAVIPQTANSTFTTTSGFLNATAATTAPSQSTDFRITVVSCNATQIYTKWNGTLPTYTSTSIPCTHAQSGYLPSVSANSSVTYSIPQPEIIDETLISTDFSTIYVPLPTRISAAGSAASSSSSFSSFPTLIPTGGAGVFTSVRFSNSTVVATSTKYNNSTASITSAAPEGSITWIAIPPQGNGTSLSASLVTLTSWVPVATQFGSVQYSPSVGVSTRWVPVPAQTSTVAFTASVTTITRWITVTGQPGTPASSSASISVSTRWVPLDPQVATETRFATWDPVAEQSSSGANSATAAAGGITTWIALPAQATSTSWSAVTSAITRWVAIPEESGKPGSSVASVSISTSWAAIPVAPQASSAAFSAEVSDITSWVAIPEESGKPASSVASVVAVTSWVPIATPQVTSTSYSASYSTVTRWVPVAEESGSPASSVASISVFTSWVVVTQEPSSVAFSASAAVETVTNWVPISEEAGSTVYSTYYSTFTSWVAVTVDVQATGVLGGSSAVVETFTSWVPVATQSGSIAYSESFSFVTKWVTIDGPQPTGVVVETSAVVSSPVVSTITSWVPVATQAGSVAYSASVTYVTRWVTSWVTTWVTVTGDVQATGVGSSAVVETFTSWIPVATQSGSVAYSASISVVTNWVTINGGAQATGVIIEGSGEASSAIVETFTSWIPVATQGGSVAYSPSVTEYTSWVTIMGEAQAARTSSSAVLETFTSWVPVATQSGSIAYSPSLSVSTSWVTVEVAPQPASVGLSASVGTLTSWVSVPASSGGFASFSPVVSTFTSLIPLNNSTTTSGAATDPAFTTLTPEIPTGTNFTTTAAISSSSDPASAFTTLTPAVSQFGNSSITTSAETTSSFTTLTPVAPAASSSGMPEPEWIDINSASSVSSTTSGGFSTPRPVIMPDPSVSQGSSSSSSISSGSPYDAPYTIPSASPSPIPYANSTEYDSTEIRRPNGYRTVGYYVDWAIYARNFKPQQLIAKQFTHLLFAFAKVNNQTGEVELADTWADIQIPLDEPKGYGNNVYGIIYQLWKLKQANRKLKTMLSIGGWTFSQNGDFTIGASTPEKREAFARTAVEMVRNFGMDGLDVDWEYPTNAQEAANYVDLLARCRTHLDRVNPKFQLSVAAPCGLNHIENLDIKGMDKYLDFWNLMAYDFAGSWSKASGHAANFFPSKSNPASTEFAFETSLNKYSAVRPDKLVVGMPLYGRGFAKTTGVGKPFDGNGPGDFEPGVYDYKSLPHTGSTVHEDTELLASWSYNNATQTMISYDTPKIANLKAEYIKKRGLGGAMWWETSSDKVGEDSLVGTVINCFGGETKLDSSENTISYPDSTYDNIRNY